MTRLEAELGTRLFQRTTREVALTEPGRALKERYTDIFSKVDDAVDYVGSLTAGPRGLLRISAGIGFGLNVLSELLPAFLERHPGINVSLELTSRLVDLVAEDVNVAIRIGAMPDLELVAKRLGTMRRYLCAAPAYLQRRGTPQTFDELHDHDLLEMPGVAGRSRSWTFAREGEHDVSVDVHTRVSVNDADHPSACSNGAGLECVSGYLCAPDFLSGRLVRLFPEWSLPTVDVNAAFPSNRELSPAIRAFIDFLMTASVPGSSWQQDLLSLEESVSTEPRTSTDTS